MAIESAGRPTPSCEQASCPPSRLDLGCHAFFLDIDGTLLEFESRPDQVRADRELLSLLLRIESATGGALALISGRTIASIDEVTWPTRFSAAGIHGFERRDANGACFRAGSDAAQDGARIALQALVAADPRLLLEDKGVGLALHFRLAPELAGYAKAAVRELAQLYPNFKIQEGRSVIELLPRIAGKGRALAAFMDESPFQGRLPIFVGDDLTDEPAFEWVNSAAGISVAVAAARPTAARASLPSVSAARDWLSALADNGNA